jgi:chromosome segregation ATPase
MTGVRAGIAAGLAILAGGFVYARQVPPAQQPDVLPALLEEVKGLRAAMEQMASAGPRIQLFTSRLQLQEARINNMIRRLDTVRDSLGSAQKEVIRIQGQQQELEASLAEHQVATTPEAREEAKHAAFMLTLVKAATASARGTADRYSAEEAQLTQEIATEQARWNGINGRLDELEKLLSRR